MSQVTISGAVSGLDTASIINQLVSVQTNQQTILKSQQTAVQKRSDAYASLAASLTSLGTQAADLAKTSAWKGATASSSSTSVTATATGTSSASITFDVAHAAAAHSLISTSTLSALSAQAASGPLTLTMSDGTTSTIEVGTGSLSDVVAAINGADAGVRAAAVHVGAGAYRLQLTAATTGAASSFTVDGLDGFDGTATLTEGTDAELTVGKDPLTAYTVTSASNTFADLVPGLSFTVSTPTTGVTVATTIDGGAVADQLTALVQNTNSILSDIASKTAYSVTTRTGGPFTGESTVRSLQQNLLSTVSLTGAPGVSLTRDGKLTFDRAAFLTAFTADPAKVARAFGIDSSFTPSTDLPGASVSVSGALKSARAGTYDIHVDTTAATEQWQIDTGGDVTGQVLTLTRGDTTIEYDAGDTDTLENMAANFNSRAAAAGFGVTAVVSDTALIFTADAPGAGRAFTADLTGGDSAQVTAGADVSGTIDGQTATGIGDVLSLPSGTGGAVGLSIVVHASPDDLAATGGDLGTVTYRPGLAQRLGTLIADATASSGPVSTARTGADSEVKRYQKQIETWDSRLTAYRQTLTTQFTAMETALAKLKSQTAALSQLTGSSSSSSSGSSSTGG